MDDLLYLSIFIGTLTLLLLVSKLIMNYLYYEIKISSKAYLVYAVTLFVLSILLYVVTRNTYLIWFYVYLNVVIVFVLEIIYIGFFYKRFKRNVIVMFLVHSIINLFCWYIAFMIFISYIL